MDTLNKFSHSDTIRAQYVKAFFVSGPPDLYKANSLSVQLLLGRGLWHQRT